MSFTLDRVVPWGRSFDEYRDIFSLSPELRVFPLLELGSRKSRHLEPVLRALRKEGYACSVETVPYEFQREGNEMLRVRTERAGTSRSTISSS